ncbi:tyrosine-type recombinase/integrase [Microbispora sp. GKU 823]|uniref:tyrosine-type recombinase/integrase n=1 Tax=Microbispora sp. GKU 823 TaxID=1652100 RepID=UPI0009C81144|nr:hypothetical protein B1L11_19755 [Microbispora sp. GKU 823]
MTAARAARLRAALSVPASCRRRRRERAGSLTADTDACAAHTAASAWLSAGVDIRTVAEYLGHADPSFTLRTYTHLMPNAADRARKAMDTFFT